MKQVGKCVRWSHAHVYKLASISPNVDDGFALDIKLHYTTVFRVTWGQGRMDAELGPTQKLPPGHACSTV